MSHRINVIIEDDTWRVLKKVPQGNAAELSTGLYESGPLGDVGLMRLRKWTVYEASRALVL